MTPQHTRTPERTGEAKAAARSYSAVLFRFRRFQRHVGLNVNHLNQLEPFSSTFEPQFLPFSFAFASEFFLHMY